MHATLFAPRSDDSVARSDLRLGRLSALGEAQGAALGAEHGGPAVSARALSERGLALEWLEADGLGGFASGTASGIRTRRYHACLLAATTPPGGRMVLVNGFEAWIVTPRGRFALTSQRYAGGIVHPDGAARIVSFSPEPWPTWHFALPDDVALVQEIVVRRGRPATLLSWRLLAPRAEVSLELRPLLSGRDYHALHHENPAFDFAARVAPGRVVWRPYAGVPGILALHDGSYQAAPDWYRGFAYAAEEERGLDSREDLATPGLLCFDLSRSEALLLLTLAEPSAGSEERSHGASDRELDGAAVSAAVSHAPTEASALERGSPWPAADDRPTFDGAPLVEIAAALRTAELARRGTHASRLRRAADAYSTRRGGRQTILAGYPWFTDWGRDTFIALRGLCLATGRLAEARDIALGWAAWVSQGMLPNRFPDRGEAPEYNSVDASLWYVVAVHELVERAGRAGAPLRSAERNTLDGAVDAILCGYAAGTRHGIRLDGDGLLAAGTPGLQLTWMDAKVGDRVVTPRIGKPVEVQALWLNALHGALERSPRWERDFTRGLESFGERFWNESRGCLHDVVDADHVAGRTESAFRPNQILAIGGLPLALLEGERARRVVDAVEARLWTPLGLRSLAPGEPGYAPRYTGGVRERDTAYHQGTVWPWLLGPFVEAWVRVRGTAREAKREARQRFLSPLLAHLDDAGLGHISEIADAEPPHTPRGCPFQAWSLGEALRLAEEVLDDRA